MKIYNTLTRTKDELKTVDEGQVKIYACGPTVYNYIHIGNARPLCVFDVLRRYLEWRGLDVRFVMINSLKRQTRRALPSPRLPKDILRNFGLTQMA